MADLQVIHSAIKSATIFVHIENAAGGSSDRAKFPQWCIGMTLQGRAVYSHAGGTLEVQAGDVSIARANTPISWQVAPRETWQVIYATFVPRSHWHQWLDEYSYQHGYAIFQLGEPTRSRVRRGLLSAHRSYVRGLRQHDEWAMIALERVLLTIYDEVAGKQIAFDQRVRAVLRCIQARYNEPLLMRDLVTVAGISSSHLSALFTQQVGMAPMQYLERIRLEQAMRLLRLTSEDITSIAASVGYNEPNYFSNRFRNYSGQSPREFRKTSASKSLSS